MVAGRLFSVKARDEVVVNGTPNVLTRERIAEINARIGQWGWAIFFSSLLGDDSKRTSEITYTATDDRFAALQAVLGSLSEVKDVRYLESSQENHNPKLYGGFGSLLTTKRAHVKRLSPPFIDTNVTVWGMDLGSPIDTKMLFFPDTLLLFQRERYKAVPYESLSVHDGTMLKVEYSPPEAAEIVGYTWLHTNLDGGPDRRYSENRRVAIALYGRVVIESTLGIRLPLLISDKVLATGFATGLRDVLRPAGTRGGSTGGSRHAGGGDKKEDGRRSSGGGRRSPRGARRPTAGSARETLRVGPDATKDEIVAAYRKMARMYHPDKVAGLGPEFKELAERRMKEINAAYAELSKAANG